MKDNIRISFYLVFVFWVSTLLQAKAQTGFHMKSADATVRGSSSLYDWSSQITRVECSGSFQTKKTVLQSMKDVQVKIEVEGIKSAEGKAMDRKIHETLDFEKNPYIIYAFANAHIRMDKSDSATIHTSGKLIMAGKTRVIELTARGKLLSDGNLQFSFSKKLRMSDFNITPPSVVFGTITVGDEITLHFNIVLTHTLQL